MKSPATSSHYPFDNAVPQAGDRFANLSALYDEVTDEPDVALARQARRALIEVVRRRGGDLHFAQELPRYLAASRLADFGAEGYFVPYRTDAVVGLARANIDQLGDALVETGLIDAAELERYRALLHRRDCFYPASMALISVWGRRPQA